MTPSFLRRAGWAARRVGRFLRDMWLVVGLAVAALVGLEFAYRVKSAMRRGPQDLAHQHEDSKDHPYATEEWWREWINGGRSWVVRFDPYRGIWPEPAKRAHFNIDSLGRRVTYDPTPNGPISKRVLLFGGSTMFGWTARDRNTIPSFLAQQIHESGITDVEFVNLAQSMFGATQGVNTLILELRRGVIPDVVVFMDGNNEVAPVFQSGRVGGILNQDQLNERLMSRPGLGSQIADRFWLIQRLKRVFRGSEDDRDTLDTPALCGDIATQYRSLYAIVRALGEHYGFSSLFYWQPMLATSGKVPTPWETEIESPVGWRSMVKTCTASVDSVMRQRASDAYIPLHDLFDGDPESVFLDDYGHVTEAANKTIAHRIATDLMPLLTSER